MEDGRVLKYVLMEKVKHRSVNLVLGEDVRMHEVIDMVDKEIVGKD